MIDTGNIEDNVTVSLFPIAELRERFSDWDETDNQTRLDRLAECDPVHQFTSHNVVIQPYREHLCNLANPETSSAQVDFTHVAFGDDATAPDPADTHLINEVYRDMIDDHVSESNDEVYKATVLIGSDEAVGLDLIEAALVSESDSNNSSDMAANRVILTDSENRLQPKDSDHAVTVRIELAFRDQSEV